MFNKQVYTDRRAKLHASMNTGIVLILGNEEAPMNYPHNTYHYRQDSTFLYFFGIDHAGFAGVMDLDSGSDIIFANDVSMGDIIWMGPQPAVKDQAAEVGVTETKPFDSLLAYINDAVSKGRKIHFTPPYRAHNMMLLEDLTGIKAKETKSAASEELMYAIIALRNIKDKYEIAHLDKIMTVGYQMHTTAMRMAIDGAHEQDIAGAVEAVALRNGGHVSFPTILSKRGETLHNHNHNNLLKTNDLLLVDCGFESSMRYATDNTRVSPVGGKFTQKQQEIYEIVLAANNNVTSQTKAGVLYRDMHFVAAKTLAQGLKDLGIMKGNVDDAVAAGAHALFQPHGLGHMLGLDVHDMEDYGETYVGYGKGMERSTQFGLSGLRLARKLEVGNVFTNEPGCYFIPSLIDKWNAEGINKDYINFDKLESYKDFGGIRLEDDLIINEDGSCRVMGDKRIPISIEELANTIGK